MRLFLASAAVACAGLFAAPAGAADPDPLAPPAEVGTTCAQFLSLKAEGQVGVMERILAYDALGYMDPRMSSRDHPGRPPVVAATGAARRAKELCMERRDETVYHVLGGTAPLYPYGLVPEGGPTLAPR
ncbi:MAG: hypothetical protein ACRC20_08040 [Segniliparus sp.]|uniref:hypothetical protein n=1 Tax=Segniliparus sp. TaxID=2804064 RepID=UPI003F3FF60B